MKLRFAAPCFLSVTMFASVPALLAGTADTNTVAAAGKDSGATATNAPAVEAPLPVSIFELTTETLDPFFPLSKRRAVKPADTNVAPVLSRTNFVLKGLSGSVGHRLAVINNRTFAPGEKWEVSTSTGKYPVTCEEIREQSVLIRIESDPDAIELFLRKGAQ